MHVASVKGIYLLSSSFQLRVDLYLREKEIFAVVNLQCRI